VEEKTGAAFRLRMTDCGRPRELANSRYTDDNSSPNRSGTATNRQSVGQTPTGTFSLCSALLRSFHFFTV